MLTFEEADNLLIEIIDFLVSCGRYREDGELQATILECLALDQYIVHRFADGTMALFVCYWMVGQDELEALEKGYRPAQVSGGTLMHLAEHGNKSGRAGTIRMTKELRRKEPRLVGVSWRHKGEQFRHFPRQRGRKGEQP